MFELGQATARYAVLYPNSLAYVEGFSKCLSVVGRGSGYLFLSEVGEFTAFAIPEERVTAVRYSPSANSIDQLDRDFSDLCEKS